MSSVSISDFILDGKQSLKSGNYLSALTVALMLPSMCARIEYKDNDSYKKQGGDFKDKNGYVSWCEEYIGRNEFSDGQTWIKTVLGADYASLLYDLGCDIVHAGYPSMQTNNQKVYFYIGKDGYSTELDQYKIVNLTDLCMEIFDATENWCANVKKTPKTQVFREDDSDDMLLYKKLKEEDKSNFLKANFLNNKN